MALVYNTICVLFVNCEILISLIFPCFEQILYIALVVKYCVPLSTTTIHWVQWGKLTLASVSNFWAGQVKIWPGWVEFYIKHIRDICFQVHALEILFPTLKLLLLLMVPIHEPRKDTSYFTLWVSSKMPILSAWDCSVPMYSAVLLWRSQFSLKSSRKTPHIARPSGRGMGCLLWVQPLIDILHQFLQWCVQYHVILDLIIMVLNCICYLLLLE